MILSAVNGLAPFGGAVAGNVVGEILPVTGEWLPRVLACYLDIGYLAHSPPGGLFGMKFRRRIRDSSGGPTTYIAPSTKIVGTISGEGAYVFCGTVEGDCDINGPVTIAEGSRWLGVLRATDIVVAGVVEGDVVSRQRVEIASTARVTGSLSGHSIAVAEGAVIEGEIKITSGESPVTFQEKRQS